MAIGPVQLFVLGFDRPDFPGQIIDELERLKDGGTIRVIDALGVHKDADGEIEIAHLSNLTMEEAIEIGSVVGALVGLGIEGEDGLEIGAVLGAEAGAEGLEVFSDEDAWDVIDEIPNDPPRRSCSLSTSGPWGFVTLSPLRAGYEAATASSTRSTSSPSALWPPMKPRRTRRSRTLSRTQIHRQSPEKGKHHAKTTQSCATHRTPYRTSSQPPPLATAHRTTETETRGARETQAPLNASRMPHQYGLRPRTGADWRLRSRRNLSDSVGEAATQPHPPPTTAVGPAMTTFGSKTSSRSSLSGSEATQRPPRADVKTNAD